MVMQSIHNRVSLTLILFWSHERGELCNKPIPAAAATPQYSIVNEDGESIDTSVENYAGEDAYGIHIGNGIVYWANSVFNSTYIAWPDDITDPVKALISSKLEKAFLIIKEG